MSALVSGGEAVRRALLVAIRADPLLAGLGMGEGGGDELPSVRVDPPQATDWGTKDARGREVRTSVALRVAAGQAERLPTLVAAVEAAGEGLRGDLDNGAAGWRVASAVLLRSASFAPDVRTRAALVEHRMRVIEG